MTLEAVVDAFLRDVAARRLSAATLRGYRITLGQFRAFAGARGVALLEFANTALLRAWRESWDCATGTARRRLNQLKAFFRFVVDSGWQALSPASGVRVPRESALPTMLLTRAEFRALLETAVASVKPKERTLLLLLRYSRLAIGDAVTVARTSIEEGSLTLRRAKSGELVFCALPRPVVDALE